MSGLIKRKPPLGLVPGGGSRGCRWAAPVQAGRPLSKALEGELRADLDVARRVPLRAIEAEARVGRVRTQVYEVWAVEGVQRLAADLQVATLAHAEVLRERQLDALEGHVAQVVQRRR